MLLAGAGLVVAAAGAVQAAPVPVERVLEEVRVTAQRRETDLQVTPLSLGSYGGAALAEARIYSVADLAASVPALSLTAVSPLDLELNIRGITNTRLDSPSADPSVGTFVDGVYFGRTGDLSYDFFDLDRIEVIRGPSGVQLGKNVAGGALSVVTAKPAAARTGSIGVTIGNYRSRAISGHAGGALGEDLAGRLSFQWRQHDGYARDVLHDRDLEDLDSIQLRAQLLWQPAGSGWSARLALDTNEDAGNGINNVARAGGTAQCETSYLRSNCTRPFSNLRAYLGIDDPRVNLPQSVQFAGDAARTQQFLQRRGSGVVLDVQRVADRHSFESLTAWRHARAAQLYDQTGIGTEALDGSIANWRSYVAYVDARYGSRPATSNNGRFLFSFPVAEDTGSTQLSQELRFVSDSPGQRWTGSAGLYFEYAQIDKTDRFIGENFLGALLPGAENPLSTLSGENRWENAGRNRHLSAFAELAYRIRPGLKLSLGVRQSEDDKRGTVSGLVVATGDRFSPTDPRAATTMESLCRRPDGSAVQPTPATCVAPNQWVFGAGTGFTTAYGRRWGRLVPQVVLEWTAGDRWFVYGKLAGGFKGGGFDDTPANVAQATTPYDPETVTSYELGVKSMLLGRRLRLNADVFYMDYRDLQVTQINAACLCNLTDNAASSTIQGAEVELEYAAAPHLRIALASSFVDATYRDFLESALLPGTNTRLDSSGNRLQRTPRTQLSAAIDYTAGRAGWQDALRFSIRYSYQSRQFWGTDNIASEPGYGLLDASVRLSVPRSSWTVGLYGRNLTDRLYAVNLSTFFGEAISQFGPPRTYGIDVGLRL